jgi:hypothetical protein
LIWAIFAYIDARRFDREFPPISDDEFMARSSCTNPEIALKVRRILPECLNIDYERIHPSATLQGDLGAE